MPIFCYREWFAEAGNDPHASFAPVLTTYGAEATNVTPQAELNAQWAEDVRLRPLSLLMRIHTRELTVLLPAHPFVQMGTIWAFVLDNCLSLVAGGA